MRKSWGLSAILAALVLLAVAATQPANQAALVVRFGEERVETYCVSFEETDITGQELLERAGLALEVQEVGMGASVCRVEDVGCAATNCFCQCRGGTCEYWSYWQMRDGDWQYAITGASLNWVAHGDVQGWSWGPGSVSEAVAPPGVTFEEICALQTGTVAPTLEEQEMPVTPTGTANIVSIATPTETRGAAQDEGTAGSEDGIPVSYVGFGVLILVLGALVVAASRRGQR